MIIEVKFYQYENDEDNEIGNLVFDGSKFSWKDLKKNWLKEILEDPLYVNDKHIYSHKTPKAFMRNLYNAYDNIYLRASKVKVSGV